MNNKSQFDITSSSTSHPFVDGRPVGSNAAAELPPTAVEFPGQSAPLTDLPEKPEIIVPADWNLEKDYDDYFDTFGESGEPPCQEVIWRIRASSNELADVIAYAVQHLTQSSDNETVLRSMGLIAQLELLQVVVNNKTWDQIRERLSSGLKRCHAAVRLRDEILSRHLLKPESVWLFELGGASDLITTAWLTLLESIQIELRLSHHWRPSKDTWLDWYE